MDRFEQAFATGLLRGLEKTATMAGLPKWMQEGAGELPTGIGARVRDLLARAGKLPGKGASAVKALAERGVGAAKGAGAGMKAGAGSMKELLKKTWGEKGEKGVGWRRAAMVGMPAAGLAGAGAAGVGLASLLRKKSKEE